jgi:subtilase family serine protease
MLSSRRRSRAVATALAVLAAAAAFSPSASAASKPDGGPGGFNCLQPPVSCYTPGAFRGAYGIQPLLSHGIDGTGVTVAVPELATPRNPGATDIRKDLASLDSAFGLPPAHIVVDNSVAHSATPYLAEGEEIEDTEIVHVVAPGATIKVVLFPQSADRSVTGFAKAITTFLTLGATGANVLSISASGGEHYFTPAEVKSINNAAEADKAHHVTVIAASGDYGAVSDLELGQKTPVKEVSLPASDPLVLAAGGTSLKANRASGAYISESAWNTLPGEPGGHSSASAGGFSHLFARPSYQNGVPGSSATRGVPDVAGDAAFNTGMAVVFGNAQSGQIISGATGTSASAPLWGGLIALADQFAGHPLGFVNPAIYHIARGSTYGVAFHDVTTGNNTFKMGHTTVPGYQATPGWDPVTGWGSPNAQVLIPLIALWADK